MDPRPHPSSIALACWTCKRAAWATRVNSAGEADPDGERATETYRFVIATHTDDLGLRRCEGSGGAPLTG